MVRVSNKKFEELVIKLQIFYLPLDIQTSQKHKPVSKLLFSKSKQNVDNSKTELYNINHNNWTVEEDYPFSVDISRSAILNFNRSFIVFGGQSVTNSSELTRDYQAYHSVLYQFF